MEEGVFRNPAVAGKLEERYVEARLHTDYEELARLQLEMTQSVAQPIYLVLDPVTGEQQGRVDGALPDQFVKLLDDAWEKARGEKTALLDSDADQE